ncbi:hypothetical protein [Streptomyces sp. NPDC091215]|uniref:hypothetical protein n=1 Tax=Streptomyces sp. NPDC091215 TaxID=3155192 RepID=UPI003433ED9E
MPDTLWTIVVAAVTAVVTTTATGVLVAPRLDARKKRLGDVHAARDLFGTHMLRIMSACSQLENLQLPPDNDPRCTPVLRERLSGERDRWWQQIDEATQWLIDNIASYAGSWLTRHLIEMPIAYAANARMVVLSEREEAAKLALLLELTVPVQRQYFGWPWARARHALVDRRTFAATIARITGEVTY